MEAMKKHKAFTLAEVLITLAIIGVVAALTIPTVVTNYKAKALETQKKKAMTVLANGFRLLMAEDNVTELKNTKLASCEDDKECILNEIKRVFNVIADNNASNDTFNTEYQFNWGSQEVWTDQMFNYVFITSDGMIFGVYPGKFGDIFVTVDLNGSKNPNKGGQDLCNFIINNKGAIFDYCSDMADWEGTPVCSAETPRNCNSQSECEAVGGDWGKVCTEPPLVHCYTGCS